MRIGLVSPYEFGFPGGVNNHITHLAEQFGSRGHEVTIFAPGPSGCEPPPEGIVTVSRAKAVRSGDSLARVTVCPLIGPQVWLAVGRRRELDILHIHEPFVGALSMWSVKLSPAPVVGTFHAAHDSGSGGYTIFGPFLRWLARDLDGRIAVSRAAAKFNGRYFPGMYEIIPNGVDVERFATPAVAPPELLARKPYVLFVGRFEERKGLPVLLRAFARLKPRHPDLQLVIVGDGNHRAAYEARVAALQLSGVHFAGYVPDNQLAAYYQNAAVYCAPNLGHESFGIVLLEAMAAGCPVVASNLDGFAETMKYGIHGLLVPPGEPGELAEALGEVLGNGGLSCALASNGRTYAAQYAWPNVADRVLEYYKRVIEKR